VPLGGGKKKKNPVVAAMLLGDQWRFNLLVNPNPTLDSSTMAVEGVSVGLTIGPRLD